jgi:hypothetical protein
VDSDQPAGLVKNVHRFNRLGEITMTLNPYDPSTLASDLARVQQIYTNFFSKVTPADWDRPARGGNHEWNLHETVAHLSGLTAVGQRGIEAALRSEVFSVPGLTNRFEFNQFNRQEIDKRLALPREALCNSLLQMLCQLGDLARQLGPAEMHRTSSMPIYNRPVTVAETLGILMFHTGLHHSAQVAEPIGIKPLWTQLDPEIRHRVIGRVVRALSLLYRYDLGGDLRAVIAFKISGEGGSNWHVDISPEGTQSAGGAADHADLTLRLRDTTVFCEMFTDRLNLPLALLMGRLRLSGNLRLFPRMGSLFSVDAQN